METWRERRHILWCTKNHTNARTPIDRWVHTGRNVKSWDRFLLPLTVGLWGREQKAPLKYRTALEPSISVRLQAGNNRHWHTGTIQEALARPCYSYYSAFSNTEEQVKGQDRPIAASDCLPFRRWGGTGCPTDTMIITFNQHQAVFFFFFPRLFVPFCFCGVTASHPISSSRLSSKVGSCGGLVVR